MVRAITSEFLVNKWWGTQQTNPDVTTLSNGNVVVVWDAHVSRRDIQYVAAKVFSPAGAPIGGERVLSNLNHAGNHARVDALDNGGFVVAWEKAPGSIHDRTDVVAATYDASGKLATPIRQVNPSGSDDFFYVPEVVGRPGGGYSVIWSELGFEITDSPFNKQDSFVRAHGANGAGGSAIGSTRTGSARKRMSGPTA